MKKMKLDAESLRVETFSTDGLEQVRGTVQANEATVPASACFSCQSCAGDCSSYPNACFCTEAASCWCQ
jgi:hypothetical protein